MTCLIAPAARNIRDPPQQTLPGAQMFGGSMVAVVTPMTANGEIDFPAWERLLHFHVEHGTDAIVAGGTTGESPTLESGELDELVRRAVRIREGAYR